MSGSAEVQAYLDGLEPEQRAVLEALRAVIRAAAPEATERISYGMPAFAQDGRPLVGYAAFARHYSLFPMSSAVADSMGERLAPWRTGKGTLQFTADEPLPDEIVEEIVRARVAENAARSR